jgi:hypothetical protein
LVVTSRVSLCCFCSVAGLVRAWRYLGGSHRIAKMRYALLLPFAMVHISFGLALYSSAADAKKVGVKNPPDGSPPALAAANDALVRL